MSKESAKEIEQLEADMGGLENLLKLERDKNTRILRESDAEIERLKRVVEQVRTHAAATNNLLNVNAA